MKRKLFSMLLSAFALLLLMGAAAVPEQAELILAQEESVAVTDEQMLETDIQLEVNDVSAEGEEMPEATDEAQQTAEEPAVRFDEIAMANKRVNVETIDMSMVFSRMDKVDVDLLEKKKEVYAKLSDFGRYNPEKLENIARFGVAVDQLIEEYDLHAVAIRCWDELEKTYGVAPCMILCELNERGIAAACELDVNNAVMMRAMYLAANHQS